MFHCCVGSLGTRCDGSIQLWLLLPPSSVSHWPTWHSCLLYLPPSSSSFLFTSRVRCLHSIFLPPCCPSVSLRSGVHQQPPSGQVTVANPPHYVPPEASDRTRCLLIASSRNPATFSLSSCKEKRKRLHLELVLFLPSDAIFLFYCRWSGHALLFQVTSLMKA